MTALESPWVSLPCGTRINPVRIVELHIDRHRGECFTCNPRIAHPDLGEDWTA